MFRRQRFPYEVTVHLNGRHPYLTSTELDYETRDVVFVVPAKDWNDAQKQALLAARAFKNWWSASVKTISHFPAVVTSGAA